MVAPNAKERNRSQYDRPGRRYAHLWKVKQLFAGYKFHAGNFLSMVRPERILILLRQLCVDVYSRCISKKICILCSTEHRQKEESAPRRPINTIIVHCAATYPDQDIGAAEIRLWHTVDNGWDDIGYHYVIRRNGILEEGRPIEKVGAHCKSHNTGSIGICLVGGLMRQADGPSIPQANFTSQQYNALKKLLTSLLAQYPRAIVRGHCDYADKDCPCFDVRQWCRNRGIATDGHGEHTSVL